VCLSELFCLFFKVLGLFKKKFSFFLGGGGGGGGGFLA